LPVCPNCGEGNPDKAKFCLECATPLRAQPAPPQEARKTVTVVFCDLVGSTTLGEELDSESLREVMDRYFAAMRLAIERHGGIVEKFIGDAVMAVFGLPRVHEDDALRAVRAADEMRRALSELNSELQRSWGVVLTNRIGVNTGEVVVGDSSSGQRLATGDAVNVAARLEQAAPPGGILMASHTRQLVHHAVTAEEMEPLSLKGKSRPLPAFLLLGVLPAAEGLVRRIDAPLVGRDGELKALERAFEETERQQMCGLVVVAGDAGVGKSRLIGEARTRLGDRARVASGRCLSYGESLAFWPLREIVFDVVAASEDASGDEIRDALSAFVDHTPTVDRVVAAIGLSSVSFPLEEIAWGVRHFFEAGAHRGPLVVVIEDLHWAEASLLDLLGKVVRASTDAAIFLLCSARLEFLDEHGGWVEDVPRATVQRLQPLAEAASAELIGNLLNGAAITPEVVERINRAAAGNPLYVEQIASMWLEEGVLTRAGGRWRLTTSALHEQIPPTISALLSARLDRLTPEERTVAATASVAGQIFYQGAVECLSPELATPGSILSKLERKGFVRRDDSTFFDEKVFAYRHVLIRDTAYAGILKRTRAELHERFADWLERKTQERAEEYDDILGYHLYEAYHYREQLGNLGDTERALGARAAAYLASSGRRALSHQASTAVTLLERAARLFPVDDPDMPKLLIDMGESLRRSEETQRAEAAFMRGLNAARALGNRDAEARANLYLLNIKVDQGQLSLDELVGKLGELEQRVGKLHNPETAAHGQALLGAAYINQGALAQARTKWDLAVAQADRSESNYVRSEARVGTLLSSLWGPDHIDDVLARAREYLRWANERGALRLRAAALAVLALVLTMGGRSDESEAHLEELSHVEADLEPSGIAGESWSVVEPDLLILRRDWAKAEILLAGRLEILDRMGVPGYMITDMTQMGEVLYHHGHIAQAEALARRARSFGSNEIAGEIRSRKLLGKCLAQLRVRGNRHARDVVDIARHTDMINLTADALCDLAEVVTVEGVSGEQELPKLLEEAVGLYERKGNSLSAARVRAWLKGL
jgi:class 3 adenylate cyclase/tetratricopeptide (TPR) repeat protein